MKPLSILLISLLAFGCRPAKEGNGAARQRFRFLGGHGGAGGTGQAGGSTGKMGDNGQGASTSVSGGKLPTGV